MMPIPHHLQRAISLSYRQMGQTGKNPSVGCVVAQAACLIAVGVTGQGGRPHAEERALEAAGDAARGANLYVSLEPCAHKCAPAIIAAGIAQVHIAALDPSLDGAGVALLKAAGITVCVYAMDVPANAGFFTVIEKKRPFVTVKLAVTVDNKIATASGDSQWITCQTARHFAHKLRSQHDAIVVGRATYAADAPQLDCRLPGLESSTPQPFIFSHQASGAAMPPNVMLNDVPKLSQQGITRLLAEGGGETAAAFLQAKLVDQLIFIRAPLLLGGDGRDAVAGMDIGAMASALSLRRRISRALGACWLECYDVLG